MEQKKKTLQAVSPAGSYTRPEMTVVETDALKSICLGSPNGYSEAYNEGGSIDIYFE